MRPCIVCLLGLVLIVICTALTLTQGLMTVLDSTNRDFLVWSDVKTYNWDQEQRAIEVLKSGGGDKQYPYRKTDVKDWNLSIIY